MLIRLILSSVLLVSGLVCAGQNSDKKIVPADKKKIFVSFVIDDSSINISHGFRFFLINKGDTLKVRVKKRQLILPRIEKDTGYTVVFMFKAYTLSFSGITKKMILPEQDVTWKFGIDNPPFNDLLGLVSNEEYKASEELKQLQYLQFDLMEFGDGIQFVKKIK